MADIEESTVIVAGSNGSGSVAIRASPMHPGSGSALQVAVSLHSNESVACLALDEDGRYYLGPSPHTHQHCCKGIGRGKLRPLVALMEAPKSAYRGSDAGCGGLKAWCHAQLRKE
jgi:hypothetical protein